MSIFPFSLDSAVSVAVGALAVITRVSAAIFALATASN